MIEEITSLEAKLIVLYDDSYHEKYEFVISSIAHRLVGEPHYLCYYSDSLMSANP